MGYTQYWRVKEDLPDFDEFAAIVMKIVCPYDGNGTRVFSNAVGKILVKGNSVKITGTYEPFCFHNKKQDFAFCKTAREPYDKYVTAILTAALFKWGSELVVVSSDGDIEDWEEGIEHYINSTGSNATKDDLKRMVQESFDTPWPSA